MTPSSHKSSRCRAAKALASSSVTTGRPPAWMDQQRDYNPIECEVKDGTIAPCPSQIGTQGTHLSCRCRVGVGAGAGGAGAADECQAHIEGEVPLP